MTNAVSYQNPYDAFSLKVGLAVISMLILFVIMTSILNLKWISIAIAVLGLTAMIYALLHREVINRPKVIRIIDDGVRLEYRTWKPLLVPWSDIEWVDAVPADKNTLKGKDTVEGRMKVRAKYWPMQLTYEIAHAVQLRYNQQLGRFPSISPSLAQRREHEARQRFSYHPSFYLGFCRKHRLGLRKRHVTSGAN